MKLECLIDYNSYYADNAEPLALLSLVLEALFLEGSFEFWTTYQFQFVAQPGALYALTVLDTVGNGMLPKEVNASVQVVMMQNNKANSNSITNISNKNTIDRTAKQGNNESLDDWVHLMDIFSHFVLGHFGR